MRHSQAKALCETKNIHRKEALENAVLEFIGQYSDPARVRELLRAQNAQADNRQEQGLSRATARLKELEQAFLNDLDRVDRGVMTEQEYLRRQEARRNEQAALETRKGLCLKRERWDNYDSFKGAL